MASDRDILTNYTTIGVCGPLNALGVFGVLEQRTKLKVCLVDKKKQYIKRKINIMRNYIFFGAVADLFYHRAS